MKENDKELTFEEKIKSEIQKRDAYIAEADSMIEAIEQHCRNKKQEIESTAADRIAIINQIHEAVNQKDASQLDKLLERLR